MTDLQKSELAQSKIRHYSLQQIQNKKIEKIIKAICKYIGNNPVHIVFDMACMSIQCAPCVTRFIESDDIDAKDIDGLNIEQMNEIMNALSEKNIVGFDITSYDLRINRVDRAFRITCEIPRLLMQIVLKIKEKKLNIFTESTKFLIWRPLDQENNKDVGWFILKNVSLEEREALIKHLDDKIITFETEDDDGEIIDVFLSVTTLEEQKYKTICDKTTTIYDCVLYPAQKMYAMFEMLNTAENTMLT
jgi:hypothetical protein